MREFAQGSGDPALRHDVDSNSKAPSSSPAASTTATCAARTSLLHTAPYWSRPDFVDRLASSSRSGTRSVSTTTSSRSERVQNIRHRRLRSPRARAAARGGGIEIVGAAARQLAVVPSPRLPQQLRVRRLGRACARLPRADGAPASSTPPRWGSVRGVLHAARRVLLRRVPVNRATTPPARSRPRPGPAHDRPRHPRHAGTARPPRRSGAPGEAPHASSSTGSWTRR